MRHKAVVDKEIERERDRERGRCSRRVGKKKASSL